MKKNLIVVLLVLLALGLVACGGGEPETVFVEVTRIVEVEGETSGRNRH